MVVDDRPTVLSFSRDAVEDEDERPEEDRPSLVESEDREDWSSVVEAEDRVDRPSEVESEDREERPSLVEPEDREVKRRKAWPTGTG